MRLLGERNALRRVYNIRMNLRTWLKHPTHLALSSAMCVCVGCTSEPHPRTQYDDSQRDFDYQMRQRELESRNFYHPDIDYRYRDPSYDRSKRRQVGTDRNTDAPRDRDQQRDSTERTRGESKNVSKDEEHPRVRSRAIERDESDDKSNAETDTKSNAKRDARSKSNAEKKDDRQSKPADPTPAEKKKSPRSPSQ